MKYSEKILNKFGDEISLLSMEDYVSNELDVNLFSEVLADKKVFEYIAAEAMELYEHKTLLSLSKDILDHSAIRWKENKERRLLIRNKVGNPIGMIGITLENNSSGEIWYYKTSKEPAFMYDALVKAIDYFSSIGIEKIISAVEEDNLHSLKMLELLSFKKERTEGSLVWYILKKEK